MASNITPLPQYADLETSAEPGAAGAPNAADAPPVGEDFGDDEPLFGLAPSQLTAIVAALGGVLLGVAFGYWLGARRARRPAARVRRAAMAADSLLELVPVAAQLARNPAVRTLAIRLLLRQLSGRRAA